jgi:hypothetical protein
MTTMELEHNHEVYAPSEAVRKQVTKATEEHLLRARVMGAG